MSGGSLILSALALTAVLSASLPAAETPAETPAPAAAPAAAGESRRDAGRGERGSRGGRFQEMLQSMREQKPAEAAEIEKLMQSDPRAAMRRAREVFPEAFSGSFSRSGGFRGGMPSRRDPWQSLMQQLKDKFPEEYAEIEKQMQTDRTGAIAKLRELAAKAGLEVPEGEPGQQRTEASLPSPRNRNRQMKKTAERIIRQLYPEDYALMVEMRDIDPDAARETFRALVREAGLTTEDLEKTALMQTGRARSVVFTDKELEEQYEQSNTGSGNSGGPWGFPGGGFRGMGMFRGGPPMNR